MSGSFISLAKVKDRPFYLLSFDPSQVPARLIFETTIIDKKRRMLVAFFFIVNVIFNDLAV